MKLIIGVLGVSLLVAAVLQLKTALIITFVPDSPYAQPEEGDETIVPKSDIAKVAMWSVVCSAALFVLAQVAFG